MSKYGEQWDRCVEFHGHQCPGLAIGYRAALAAKARLNLHFSEDEELVCVTENDACGVDAVQVLTGCTMGKGNLIYRGTGKQAFSFFDREADAKLRLVLNMNPHRDDTMDRDAVQDLILTASDADLFAFSEPSFPVPDTARIFNSIECEICGERAPEHKIRLHDEKKVCLDCVPDYSRGW